MVVAIGLPGNVAVHELRRSLYAVGSISVLDGLTEATRLLRFSETRFTISKRLVRRFLPAHLVPSLCPRYIYKLGLDVTPHRESLLQLLVGVQQLDSEPLLFSHNPPVTFVETTMLVALFPLSQRWLRLKSKMAVNARQQVVGVRW